MAHIGSAGEVAENATFRPLRIAMFELILSNQSNSVNNDS
jgi:hypothetical protein